MMDKEALLAALFAKVSGGGGGGEGTVVVANPTMSGNEDPLLGIKIANKKYSLDRYYAKLNGKAPNLTAGNAEQLVSSVGINDKVPYNFRTTGGSADVGNRKNEKIIGGTIGWNQLSDNSRESTTTNDITFTNNGDGSITVSGTASDVATFNSVEHSGVTAHINHIYYIAGCPNGGNSNTYYLQDPFVTGSGNRDTGSGTIIKRTSSSPRILTQILVKAGTAITSPVVFRPNIIDLTLLFGSTIADYLYTLETATPGAGVAKFRQLFPKPYYAYNAGGLLSVKVSKAVMAGFNQWDEQWATNITIGSYGSNFGSLNYIPVIPEMTYHFTTGTYSISGKGLRLAFYDAEKNLISSTVHYSSNLQIPQDCHFIKFGLQRIHYGDTYKNDICINLHWDGERDGEYEAFSKNEYPLDSTKELRGVWELDANDNLYCDGDEYESVGAIKRKRARVDLGTLNWGISTGAQSYGTSTGINTLVDIPAVNTTVAKLLCTKFAATASLSIYSAAVTNGIAIHTDGQIRVVWDNMPLDPDDIKAALNGVYLEYPLATPTTESAAPYTNPMVDDDWGTEEFVDAGVEAGSRDVAVPVGHDTFYQTNLKAKLEMAPDSPSGDGDYFVRQNNGTNEYVGISSNAIIAGLLARVPEAPAEDGTYTLKATVASGVKTYAWVADE